MAFSGARHVGQSDVTKAVRFGMKIAKKGPKRNVYKAPSGGKYGSQDKSMPKDRPPVK